MSNPFLLTRVLLQFDDESDDLLQELSAAAFTPDGSLWVGSDEFLTVERLLPKEAYIYGDHKPFFLKDFIELSDDSEADIEGMDYADSYLWFTGSHSQKRKKTKGKKVEKDLERLTQIKTELNRYILGRVPVVNGELLKSGPHPEDPSQTLTAACLERTAEGNILTEALKRDRHLGPMLSCLLPGKDNGLDVEGLAVHGNTIFLGLRGPVLRGWAIILELEVEAQASTLTLKAIGSSGQPYKKHFLNLNGLGIRELCLQGEDLIVLAGPTMVLEGAMQAFRLKQALGRAEDSLIDQDSDELELLFNLPFTIGSDHAEGLALMPCLGESQALLILYDAPDARRRVQSDSILMDVFKLP